MYVKIENGVPVPYSLKKFRQDHPETAFPALISTETLLSYGVVEPKVLDKPVEQEGSVIQRNALPDLIEGVWVYDWHYEPILVEPFQVKAEAERRILAILPEWKQRNLTARAAELAMIGQVNWTAEEQAEWDAGQALWNQIKAVRASSDALEAMDPIPHDYQDDKYWS